MRIHTSTRVRASLVPGHRPAGPAILLMGVVSMTPRLWSRHDAEAEFSSDGSYRYSLSRMWDTDRPVLSVVMLAPMRAGKARDVHTLRHFIKLAEDLGYGAIIVRNLYALVCADSGELDGHPDPVGPHNDAALSHCCEHDLTVMAWGSDADPARAHEVARHLWEDCRRRGTSLAVMGWTSTHQPLHPDQVSRHPRLECLTPTASHSTHEFEDPRWSELLFSCAAA